MKGLACILTLTVLFLAFKPAVDFVIGLGCHDVSCCVEECNPFLSDLGSGEEPVNDCDGNSCNPFQVCGNSFVYESAKVLLEEESHEAFVERHFSYQQNYASQFLQEFWQPPKIS